MPTRQGGVKNRDKVYQVFAYNYRDDSRAQWDDSSLKNNPPLSTSSALRVSRISFQYLEAWKLQR